jgi:hypothetical protein
MFTFLLLDPKKNTGSDAPENDFDGYLAIRRGRIFCSEFVCLKTLHSTKKPDVTQVSFLEYEPKNWVVLKQ